MASQLPSNAAPSTKPRPPKRQRPDYRNIHRFPLPVTIHPLPPLIVHNPLSVVSVLLSYLTYFIAPPHHDTHSAYFDSRTSSIHVTDEKTIRALWEMGFFGKGSLSRSEPTWLDQEKKRRGLLGGVTSEEVTRQRRAERRELKLQRARSEKLIIEQRLQAEAAARENRSSLDAQSDLAYANGAADGNAITAEKFSVKKAREAKFLEARQLAERDKATAGKTVHFAEDGGSVKKDSTVDRRESLEELAITNEEHLQLSNEEAFFLVYGLGALHIWDEDRKTVLSPNSLLTRLCHHSYSPPRDLSADLKTDDPFLVSYAVYHHFRSLGWVVRSGVKFGADYLLYNRGPVFSHAEFAIIVLPSYDHPYWSETEERRAECDAKQARSWWWLHCVNRVQAQVKKTLVVCYVEIPPPTQTLKAEVADSLDIGELLGRYLVHDLIALPQTDGLVSISATEDATGKNTVHGDLEPREKDDNATETIDITPQSPKRTVQTPAAEAPAAKMSSAETIPSDTQVISQSVYDEIIRKNKEAGNDGLDSVFDRNTLMTLQEGDSGHLDLLSGLDGAHNQVPNTDEDDDQNSSGLEKSSPLTYEHNPFPESQRFLAKTPATATKQHDKRISTASPLVSRNPLASDPELGSGIMALSQVFKATQAPSSPLVNGLQSDLLSDRPSPNIPIQHRPLAPSFSSPLNTMAATFPQDSSDTQLNYVTMKESQANRSDMLRERMTRSADHIYSEDQSDGEFDKEPSFLERMRRQRRDDEEATGQLALLSAPARQSSEMGNRIGSSPRRSEHRGPIGDSTRDVFHGHGPASELQAVGTSEEETEQEDESPKPTPRSQLLNSSNTEEDKENCNDPSAVILSHTESAHDRLSQALSFHESDLATRRETAHSFSVAQCQNDGPGDDIRSSPISVVKDSQWSPRHTEQADQGIVESPSNRGLGRVHGSQPQLAPADGDENGGLSPAKPAPFQHPMQPFQNAPATLPSTHSDIAYSARSSAQSREGSVGPQANMVRFTNSMAPSLAGNGDKATADFRGKSSSMPSRVAETPVHQRQSSSNEMPTLGTIPETSPNRLNNDGWMSDGNHDAAGQEDDDLPPLYPGALKRTHHSQPVMSSSSPIKPSLGSKILSSPSGRQRRALTEIAADASPQVGGSAFDVNMNIMSADDLEFRNAVAMSPIPSRKKRRGNDGRNIPASDPVIPVTPRPVPRFARPQEVAEEEAVVEAPPQPAEMSSRGQNLFSGRTKPSRRSRSIWDTEDSPKFRMSSKERSKIFARSQARERQQSPVSAPQAKEPLSNEPELKETPQLASVSDQVAVPVSSAPVPEAPSSAPDGEEIPVSTSQQPSGDAAVLAPNQVLAIWKGRQRAYFPAVCFGKPFGNSQDQYLVKFEDSAPVEVQRGTVKRLELRVGDEVKIDMPNVPKVPHIIRGFADKLSADELANGAVTDVYGHATLVVGLKQRKSLPNSGLAGPDNVISVPVSRIYLDMILWNKFKDRAFVYSGSGNSDDRLQTPSDRHTTPTSPSTRLSRSFRQSGLFSGMVFAVSFGDKSESKFRVTKMIVENDGRILEDGFNELFDLPSNAPLGTPTKASAPQSTGTHNNLSLKSSAEEIGFACLIADKHSRRPKYMQALALNLPCLSDRWIEDCVVKGRILDWEMYLLPAGESSYLNGATKSRILAPYLATKARLSETVAARPNLLNGQSVLLVTGRSGKADEERRKAYIFLTYALGASKIERVPDIQSARDVLNGQWQAGQGASAWDWIYIDDDDKAAKTMARSASSASQSTKRRRKSRLTESFNGDDLGLNSNVRIVGNEFVCQSLILGKLVDQ
ncbi:hypothetical protein BDV18DRAFT_167301 [Aspergillus unguis]